MADNSVVLSGDTIAADDIAGVKYQRVKMVHGIDGVNDGDTASANPLPVTLPAAQSDAFGRFRVAQPETLFDSKQVWDNGPLFWNDVEVSGGSTTSNHSANTASTTLGVGATTAGNRVRQTYQRFNYQPGKSQLVFITGVLDKSGGGTGITRRMGLYDANNGIFLEDAEGTYNIVSRSFTSGSAVDTQIVQSSWNVDPMDGTGPSGVTLDFTKSQILLIDFEWLGVGRVRVGFVVDGAIYYAHQFLNANTLSVVYMSTPNLPVRYEIDNGGTGAASTMECICSSVISEGGSQLLGVPRSASTDGTHVDCATENTIYAVIGIRLKSAYIGCTISLESTSLQIHTATEKCEWMLLFNPTVAGTFTYADETNSAVGIARGAAANTVTGGTRLAGGYIESGGLQSGGAGSNASGLPSALKLGAAVDGTLDTMVLCIRPIAGSTDVDVEGTLNWRELV